MGGPEMAPQTPQRSERPGDPERSSISVGGLGDWSVVAKP